MMRIIKVSWNYLKNDTSFTPLFSVDRNNGAVKFLSQHKIDKDFWKEVIDIKTKNIHTSINTNIDISIGISADVMILIEISMLI